ncbi:unnamed protein product [Blepharisma stoltei]|uniref:Uncharacterized protein n=1 Tax=Blepharisma stoltei TaxID=1481888 RepID=A0AAU9JZE0_9CILI|nr:unnamed protein product [Blepharisma stoltei]
MDEVEVYTNSEEDFDEKSSESSSEPFAKLNWKLWPKYRIDEKFSQWMHQDSIVTILNSLNLALKRQYLIYLSVVSGIYCLLFLGFSLGFYFYQLPNLAGTIIFTIIFLGSWIAIARSKELKSFFLQKSMQSLILAINEVNNMNSNIEIEIPNVVFKLRAKIVEKINQPSEQEYQLIKD